MKCTKSTICFECIYFVFGGPNFFVWVQSVLDLFLCLFQTGATGPNWFGPTEMNWIFPKLIGPTKIVWDGQGIR